MARPCRIFVMPSDPWKGAKPYGHRAWMTLRGRKVWLFRKGQKCRWYDASGRQVGPEQTNVAPAIAFALHHRWVSL